MRKWSRHTLDTPAISTKRRFASKLEFVHGVATRTLSTPGNYYYGTGGGLMWYEEGAIVRVF